MGEFLRRLKAAAGLGILWSAASFVVGAVAGLVFGGMGLSFDAALQSAMQYAAFGLFAGTGFAAILAAVEGRKTLEGLSVSRIALLGAVAGLSFPLIIALIEGGASLAILRAMLPVLGVTAVLGAGLSTATVLLARTSTDGLSIGAQTLDLVGVPETDDNP